MNRLLSNYASLFLLFSCLGICFELCWILGGSCCESQTTSAPCNGTVFLSQMMNSPALRLGNKMFMFASSYGIAKQLNMHLVAHFTTDLSMLTTVFHDFSVEKSYVESPPELTWSEDRYADSWRDIPCHRSISTFGYMQSWRYFHPYRDELKEKIFIFKEDIRKKGRKGLEIFKKKWKENNANRSAEDVEIVGIHVRRGDFTSSQYLGFVPGSKEFVLKALQNLPKHSLILILSDDSAWCYEAFGSLHPNIFVLRTSPDPALDLFLLTQCDTIVLSAAFSTFGWWGAYLSDAKAVYYNKEVVKKDSHYGRQVKVEDHCPPNWIPL